MVIKFVRIVSIGLCWRHMDRLLLLTLMAMAWAGRVCHCRPALSSLALLGLLDDSAFISSSDATNNNEDDISSSVGVGSGFSYDGRLPVHSNIAGLGTSLFIMDAKTGAYTFGYDTGGGEHQSYRVETRSADGTVTGRYGYVDPQGVLRIVDYVADKRGYRPKITVKYPVLTHRATSFIGPIPSPILQEESRLKTRKIPFGTPLVTASLPNFTASLVPTSVDDSQPAAAQVVIRDVELPESPLDGFRISSVNVVSKISQNSLPFSS